MFLPRINLVIGYWVRISTSPLIALSIQFRLFWIICSQKVDTEIFDFRENKKIILTNDRKLRSRINYVGILIWDKVIFFTKTIIQPSSCFTKPSGIHDPAETTSSEIFQFYCPISGLTAETSDWGKCREKSYRPDRGFLMVKQLDYYSERL